MEALMKKLEVSREEAKELGLEREFGKYHSTRSVNNEIVNHDDRYTAYLDRQGNDYVRYSNHYNDHYNDHNK